MQSVIPENSATPTQPSVLSEMAPEIGVPQRPPRLLGTEHVPILFTNLVRSGVKLVSATDGRDRSPARGEAVEGRKHDEPIRAVNAKREDTRDQGNRNEHIDWSVHVRDKACHNAA